MDTGLKGMGRKKNYYSTDEITITVINTRSVKSKVNMVARGIRERIKEMNTERIKKINSYHGQFIKDIISKGRLEIYIKLSKIDIGQEATNFIYQINSMVREQSKI